MSGTDRADEIVRDAVTADVKATAQRRVMVNRQVKVPEPYQDENADSWWAEGHVEPALFLLGCLWVTQRDCGDVRFVDWLHDRELLDAEKRTYAEAEASARRAATACGDVDVSDALAIAAADAGEDAPPAGDGGAQPAGAPGQRPDSDFGEPLRP